MAKATLIVACILLVLAVNAYSSDSAIQFFESQLAIIKGDSPQPLFDPETPAPKCGTPVLAGIYLLEYRGIELPASLQEDRPTTLPLTFGGVHVLVHYTDVGPDSVYQASVDTLPADGVPDFVNRISEIFEYVWEIETGNPDSGFLGFNPPISDDGRGGDNRFDVYVLNLGAGYYGFTAPEGFAGQYQVASFIELENDFSGTIYQSRPVDGVMVTAAHEFFHAIQFGYDALEFDFDDAGNPDTYKPWWLEASAVWVEEIVYDDLNDYLNYLPYFYNYPWMNLGTFSYTPGDPRAYHPYASCVWPVYLTEKHGIDIIKEIWEGCAVVPGYNTLIVTNDALTARSSSLDEGFTEFSIWNYYTGVRANPVNYYSEGASFPEVDPSMVFSNLTSVPVSIGDPPDPPEHLGANYIVVQTGSSSGGLVIDFDGADIIGAEWHGSVLGYSSLLSEWIDLGINPSTGLGSLEWYNWDDYDDIVIIPTVSGTTPYYISYSYSGSLAYDSSLYGQNIVYVWPGDLDNNGIVNAEDILPLAINWYEVGNARDRVAIDWSPMANELWITPGGTFADADGSGQVDIRDFLPICLNWNLTHNGTFVIGAQPNDFDMESHRPVLDIIYNEVRNANSGPRYEIRIYLEKLLGISVPDNMALLQNYPNPFNNSTSIVYQTPELGLVKLTVFNLLGQKVITLVNEEKAAGTYSVEWDGRDDKGRIVSSGIYLYRLESTSFNLTKKMLLIK
jgi:hypothetical protein